MHSSLLVISDLSASHLLFHIQTIISENKFSGEKAKSRSLIQFLLRNCIYKKWQLYSLWPNRKQSLECRFLYCTCSLNKKRRHLSWELSVQNLSPTWHSLFYVNNSARITPVSNIHRSFRIVTPCMSQQRIWFTAFFMVTAFFILFYFLSHEKGLK